MRTWWFVLAALFFLPLPARAQLTAGRLEVFTGYSYGQWNTGGELSNNQYVSLSGWDVAPSLKLFPFIRLAADVSGYAGSFGAFVNNFGGTGIPVDLHEHSRVYSFTAGPEAGIRLLHFRPFAHGLVGATKGVIYDKEANGSGQIVKFETDHTRLSFAVGGGLDWNLTRHVSFRVFQIDWFRTNFSDFANSSGTLFKAGRQNSARISTGLVWRFGLL